VRLTSAILLLPLLAGCRNDAGATPKPAPAVAHVDTAEVGERPMPAVLALTGNLKGERQTDLAAGAMGRVVSTSVERGAYVKQGDIVARLDVSAAALAAAEARANLELSRAQADTARRECERYTKLRDRGAVSQLEYDRQLDQCVVTRLSATSAEVRTRTAAKNVADGVIRAPFAGFVAERHIEVGQYVRSDSPVVTLVQTDPLRLEFTVAEAQLAQIKQGATLTFTVPAYPDVVHTGTVRYLGAAVRGGTHDLVVEAVVDNADGSLRPGMFATISLRVADTVLPVVPKSAIRMRDGKSCVMVVANKRIEERVVLTATSSGNDVAIARGLRAHERIVLQPSESVANGQYVD
jgi:membrane fusion protein, multidrug efflux system